MCNSYEAVSSLLQLIEISFLLMNHGRLAHSLQPGREMRGDLTFNIRMDKMWTAGRQHFKICLHFHESNITSKLSYFSSCNKTEQL